MQRIAGNIRTVKNQLDDALKQLAAELVQPRAV